MCDTKKYDDDCAFVVEFSVSPVKKKKLCKFYHWDNEGNKHEVKIGDKHLIGYERKDGNYGVYKNLPNSDSIDISDC